jgi:DNA primase
MPTLLDRTTYIIFDKKKSDYLRNDRGDRIVCEYTEKAIAEKVAKDLQWFEDISRAEPYENRYHIESLAPYAVSDHNGNYVAYFDDRREAQDYAADHTKDLRDSGHEFGQYAVMWIVRDGIDAPHYELM